MWGNSFYEWWKKNRKRFKQWQESLEKHNVASSWTFFWKCPIVSHNRSLTVLQVSIPFPSIQFLKKAGTNSSHSHKLHIGFSLAHSGQSRALSHCISFVPQWEVRTDSCDLMKSMWGCLNITVNSNFKEN